MNSSYLNQILKDLHQHDFKLRYRIVGDDILYFGVCKCGETEN